MGEQPKSYRKIGGRSAQPVDPKNITVVHELDAILRVRWPMQKKWISVRGKRTSCPWCPNLYKLRYTEWGAKVECRWGEGKPVYTFPMPSNDTPEDPDECKKE